MLTDHVKSYVCHSPYFQVIILMVYTDKIMLIRTAADKGTYKMHNILDLHRDSNNKAQHND